MTAQPHRCEVIHLTNARKITACNSVFAPVSHDAELAEAAPFWTDENAPIVDLSPPPAWAARRRQMRRDGLQVIACVVMFIALIGFAMTPDTAVMRAQVEASQ